jgi:hypothetical protein
MAKETSKDVRVNAVPGTQNDDTIDFNSFRLSLDNLNSDTVIQTMIGEFIAPIVKLFYPRRAEVIQAELLSEEAAKFYGIPEVSAKLKDEDAKYIVVTAYDDFVDSLIRKPTGTADDAKMSFFDRALTLCLKQTSTFYGTKVIGDPIPEIGDIVWIDYADRANKRGGIYKGVAEKIGVMPGGIVASAYAAFENIVGTIGDMLGETPGNETLTPALADISDLCEGPIMEKGSSFGGGTVETVVIDGLPVAKDVAGYYVTMKGAARAAGVTLTTSSAMRESENVNTLGCPDGKADIPGQKTLYAKNCEGDVCDPKTAKDGESNHQKGNAFDIDMEMPSWNYSGNESYPNEITPIYKWMMLNAHNYGFIRGVDTERWHWEYVGAGSSQFAKVSRNHPSWDEFFINGEGVDTL